MEQQGAGKGSINPLPWRVNQNDAFKDIVISDHEPILSTRGNTLIAGKIPFKTADANAAYIVKSANAFPKLMEVLKYARRMMKPDSDLDYVDTLLQTLNAEESK